MKETEVTDDVGGRCESCGELAVFFTGSVRTRRVPPGLLPVVVDRETKCGSCGAAVWVGRDADRRDRPDHGTTGRPG